VNYSQIMSPPFPFASKSGGSWPPPSSYGSTAPAVHLELWRNYGWCGWHRQQHKSSLHYNRESFGLITKPVIAIVCQWWDNAICCAYLLADLRVAQPCRYCFYSVVQKRFSPHRCDRLPRWTWNLEQGADVEIK